MYIKLFAIGQRIPSYSRNIQVMSDESEKKRVTKNEISFWTLTSLKIKAIYSFET
jgi:hypothetical protein